MIAPGFADPADAAQRHFRAVLEAMSRPGRMMRLDGELPSPPQPLLPATWAIVTSLLDHETPLWLEPSLASQPVISSLRFHVGCRLVDDPRRVAFAVATAAGLPPLHGFAQGEPDYPDRSTTVIVEVGALATGRGATLRGPGIDGRARLYAAGMKPSFWAEWRGNHAGYPLGIDVILTDGAGIACLPRSTAVDSVVGEAG